MKRLIPLLALATLAACSPATESEPADAAAEAAAPAAAAAPTALGGVDLTQPLLAMGSEPFWTVEIVDGVATWKDISDFSGDVTTPRTGPAVPTAAGDGVAYAITLADGTAVTLTLTAGPCADVGGPDPAGASRTGFACVNAVNCVGPTAHRFRSLSMGSGP